MKGLLRQFMRFSAVGVSAFAIDYVLLIVFTEACGINYLLSAALSYSISTVYNYMASMRFVYRHREALARPREFALFVALSLVGLGLNTACMWFGVEIVGGYYLVVKIVSGVVVSFWNFFSRRTFLDADVAQRRQQAGR